MTGKDVRPRIDFAVTPVEPNEEKIKTAQHFDELHAEQHFIAQDLDPAQAVNEVEEITLEQSLRPKLPLWARLLLLGILIVLVSGMAQLVQTIITAWVAQQWFTIGMATAGVMIVCAGITALLAEFARLRRLKKQMNIHHQARRLLSNHSHHHAVAFCESLIKDAGLPAEHPAVVQWQMALDPSLSDKEVITLYSSLVQPTFDNQARRLIRQTATQSAIMVAASPYALVDMGLVAWRSLRMINQIAKLYQVEPGYFGRIKLLRALLVNMAIAGASEWIQESSIDWLSQDLAARLSGRVAQGVGIGLLTARLGIKTMSLCRPIPWFEGEAPKVSEFRRGLIADLGDKLRQRKPN
ncbi:putative membrane protein [Rosenbergiella nectarea]|uniref:Putative membrane protein n=1 Tax=Rosenbergiella nectarea TaxID=988801 RepID=A0A1H9G1W3_9GAMM|nr:TIGR01620 family protein [Rosenbergiella nectarea]SEQ43923.1 putative membrane protein [Rosenbergiella nectarea]